MSTNDEVALNFLRLSTPSVIASSHKQLFNEIYIMYSQWVYLQSV